MSHRLNRATSLTLFGNWQTIDFETDDREYERWQVSVSLIHQIYRDVNGSVGYSHVENSSTEDGQGYSENRVDARVTVVF
jgi:uncharacterized protein (PEP-CTERM system associated)